MICLYTAVPAEHWNESNRDASQPVDDNDDDGEAWREVAAVVVRIADCVVSFNGNHQQTED